MPSAYFVGEVRVIWLKQDGPDRLMELLEDFKFFDPTGKEWIAPKGRKIDGASIPRILWTVAGDPFIGDYRRASVLHDVACDDKVEPHKSVHRMFYDAMICDGVDPETAAKFYTAVRLFGPKWDIETGLGLRAAGVHRVARPVPTIEQIDAALDAVLRE
jgi:hypothetical protein